MRTIAIFDSGVGGLSIYQAVRRHLPDERYIFVSDNQAFPYGTKSEQELIPRVIKVIGRLIDRYSPDLIVIACNTASTVVLPSLRERWPVQFVGVVPAIKPAAALSRSQCIGVLATPATIERAYTMKLIEDFASDCRVVRQGSSRLVTIAEQKLCGVPMQLDKIEVELAPFLARPELDTLVLACTHFPLLNNEIKGIFENNSHPVMLVDSGDSVARRVSDLLGAASGVGAAGQPNLAVFTRALGPDSALPVTLQSFGFGQHEILEQ